MTFLFHILLLTRLTTHKKEKRNLLVYKPLFNGGTKFFCRNQTWGLIIEAYKMQVCTVKCFSDRQEISPKCFLIRVTKKLTTKGDTIMHVY